MFNKYLQNNKPQIGDGFIQVGDMCIPHHSEIWDAMAESDDYPLETLTRFDEYVIHLIEINYETYFYVVGPHFNFYVLNFVGWFNEFFQMEERINQAIKDAIENDLPEKYWAAASLNYVGFNKIEDYDDEFLLYEEEYDLRMLVPNGIEYSASLVVMVEWDLKNDNEPEARLDPYIEIDHTVIEKF